MQAANPEGSLITQLQRLRQHLAYKRDAVGERWEEAAVYELRAVSGKDSVRSPEFARLFDDIRAGRVNTIVCTALSRICRNLRDFLDLLEVLEEHGVEFCSLKEQFDTTTTHGRLLMTILMALAEFEREQTAERTSDAMQARSERGLWNGGQIFGFDVDPDRKGYLLPNEAEAMGVNFAIDTYLEVASIAETAARLNRAGYRTKAYTSRRGRHHPGREFSFTTVQHMLKNVAYIGKKKVATAEGLQLVESVWPAIVEIETFERVQAVLAANARSNHGGTKRARHVYVLSAGLLHCGRCGTAMEGRSGTGRGGRRYFYYACRGAGCPMRVVADEVEGAVLGRVRELAADGGVVERLVAATNQRLQRRLPALRKQRTGLKKALDDVVAEADRLLSDWSTLPDDAGQMFVADRLRSLSERREDLERGIADADRELSQAESARVSTEVVQLALANVDEVYEHLKPHERKELMRLLLQRAEVGDRSIVLEISGAACAGLAETSGAPGEGASRYEVPKWLPDVDSNHEPTG